MPPSFHSPANITLVSQVLGNTNLVIERISFFYGTNLIGNTTPSQPLVWNNVNAGQYLVIAGMVYDGVYCYLTNVYHSQLE